MLLLLLRKIQRLCRYCVHFLPGRLLHWCKLRRERVHAVQRRLLHVRKREDRVYVLRCREIQQHLLLHLLYLLPRWIVQQRHWCLDVHLVRCWNLLYSCRQLFYVRLLPGGDVQYRLGCIFMLRLPCWLLQCKWRHGVHLLRRWVLQPSG